MNVRGLLLLSLIALTSPGLLGADEILGTITEVRGREVVVKSSGPTLPRAGDELAIFVVVPDLGEARVGTGAVTTVTDERVLATVSRNTSPLAVGQRVRITSLDNAAPASTEASQNKMNAQLSKPTATVMKATRDGKSFYVVLVPANRAWSTTGLTFAAGERFRILARGTVEAAGAAEPRAMYHRVPPEGRVELKEQSPQPTLPGLALLGRCGNGKPFPAFAGDTFKVLEATAGELSLGINDRHVTDNSGSWIVEIERLTSQSSSPSTATRRGEIMVPDDFKTIGQALAAAAEGTKIRVQPGRYDEYITLKNGVSLIGVDREKVVITSEFTVVVADHCSRCEMRGITIEGRKPTDNKGLGPIVSLAASSVTLVDCAVRSEEGARVGISCVSGDKSSLSRCLVDSCFDGIHASGEKTDVALEQNTCQRNLNCGIIVSGSASARIQGCTCASNKSAGIAGSGKETRLVASNNDCRENEHTGIYAAEMAFLEARNNRCERNRLIGISLTGKGTNGRLSENQCRANAVGISVSTQATATIVKNLCANNTQVGIEATEAGIRAEDNTVERNDKAGILASNCNVILKRNECLSNGLHGIALQKNCRGELRGNRCLNNTQVGLYLSRDVSVEGEQENSFQGNGRQAVYRSESTD